MTDSYNLSLLQEWLGEVLLPPLVSTLKQASQKLVSSGSSSGSSKVSEEEAVPLLMAVRAVHGMLINKGRPTAIFVKES